MIRPSGSQMQVATGSSSRTSSAARSAWRNDGAPVGRHGPFVVCWASRVSSTVALQMQAVAVSWQMYDLTRSPLDLGLVGLTQFVPAALLVLVAGHVADRYDRRMIARSCQMVSD